MFMKMIRQGICVSAQNKNMCLVYLKTMLLVREALIAKSLLKKI